MRHRLTEEEKIAKQLAKVVSDVTVNLDEVGRALARAFPNVIFRRLDIIVSSAEYEKEAQYDREHINPLF